MKHREVKKSAWRCTAQERCGQDSNAQIPGSCPRGVARPLPAPPLPRLGREGRYYASESRRRGRAGGRRPLAAQERRGRGRGLAGSSRR